MAEAGGAAGLPLVIKVGGSLAETGRLKDALATICDAGRPVVVVPGGGSFVDKVRDLQHAVRFNDAAAHRLAMLGMHQMAEIFVALEPRLRVSDSVAEVGQILARGETPVWVPLPTLDKDDKIPADWSVTSDSIAARLAELLGGAPLALLKSIDVEPAEAAVDLARDGVVDATFPGLVARARLDWRIFGPSDDAAFTMFLVPSPRRAL